jgi:hypothetical protein
MGMVFLRYDASRLFQRTDECITPTAVPGLLLLGY